MKINCLNILIILKIFFVPYKNTGFTRLFLSGHIVNLQLISFVKNSNLRLLSWGRKLSLLTAPLVFNIFLNEIKLPL